MARTADALLPWFQPTAAEREAIGLLADGGLPLGLTPHFLSLIDPDDPDDPVRRQMLPQLSEWADAQDDRRDPLGEEAHEPLPNLIHRYPDRALIFVTDRCASYCRFCTRKRLVGQGPTPKKAHLADALDYIAARPAIREVILSGGDALVLDDERLDALLGRIRAIDHVEIIRIASRTPAFCPMRVTPALIAVLKKHQPVYLLVHFNHPRELGPAAMAAIGQLVDGGVPVLNQTVLMRGVNDDTATLAALFRHLTRLRARPYYLHQCDLAPGTAPFRVPLDRALSVYGALRGHVSGLSQPTFVVDIPGGFGKVPLHPDPIVRRTDTHVYLRGFEGEVAAYPLDT